MAHDDLSSHTSEPDPAPTEREKAPRTVGPFKVLDVLGEGGMGVVYLAEQAAPVRRRVALKILKRGMDTKQVLARFESERQALAVMDHPNIAKVLDGGVTDDGRPYFVMEMVHGTPITDYADTHRLTTTERLRLFMDVCRAIQHAHHKGVIHRDLKPSNVLASVQESGPVVKVIDFGIAKAVGLGLTDRTLVTHAGQMLGTPEYMSPEQAEMSGLDIDTRTDIYSLGVMLYELIVGVRPFELGNKPGFSISHTLRERDVPRPSTKLTSLGETVSTVARYRSTTPESLRRELKGDLDWIILKAMEKDRTHRYDTANALAVDLQRHLDNEPVLARPPSARDRVRKFVRRNRTGVLAATIAAFAVLGGSAAATVGFVQARQEQLRAERSAATAEQVSEFLIDVFRVSDPSEALGNTITAREVLDRGAARIQTELADQPAVQARLLRTIGMVYHHLGLYEAARPLFERAVAVGEAAPRRDDAELALALQRLGILYRHLGNPAAAEDALRRALDLASQTGAFPDADIARTLNALAGVYLQRGRLAEAEPLLLEVLAIQEQILEPEHADLAATVSNLGAIYLNQRLPASAHPYLRRAVEILERTVGPNHPQLARTLNNLGQVYYMEGKYAEAEATYRRGLEMSELTLGPDHPDTAKLLHNLGDTYLAQGRPLDAERLLRRALHVKETVLGDDHIDVSTTLRAIANVYSELGRYDEAEPLYLRSLGIRERRLSAPDADATIQETLEDYARLLRLMQRTDEAAELDRRAARIRAARTSS